MQEKELSEQSRVLIRRCDDLSVDLGDAIGTEFRGLRSTDPPSLHLAIDAHVDVMSQRSELISAAIRTSDSDVLYAVAAALALIEDLSPWPIASLSEIRAAVDHENLRVVEPNLVEGYREWLGRKTADGLGCAALTAAGALAISCAFIPVVPDKET